MRMRLFIVTLALICGVGLAVAQDREAEGTRPEGEDRSAMQRLKDRVQQAIRLPRSAEEAREAGVDRDKVREVLRTGRDNGVSADDMKVILDTENAGLRQGGNPENFGAAVQAMKASGLRGRELAEAIHAEQAARGMRKQERHREQVRTHAEGDGKGQGSGQGQGSVQGQGSGKGQGSGAGRGSGGSQGEMQKKAEPRGGDEAAGQKKQESGSQGGKGKGKKGGGRP